MTKEEIYRKNHGQSEWEFQHNLTSGRDCSLNAMEEYGKQQAIAFYEYNSSKLTKYHSYHSNISEAELSYLEKYHSSSIEERYIMFIESQQNNG
jgi:hypothetical protein